MVVDYAVWLDLWSPAFLFNTLTVSSTTSPSQPCVTLTKAINPIAQVNASASSQSLQRKYSLRLPSIPIYLPRRPCHHRSVPLGRTHEDAVTVSELTLRRSRGQQSSAAMRDTLSAMSEQVSVGNGRIKEKSQCDYTRALRKVADGADIMLLVLDAGSRQLVGEKMRRCKAKRSCLCSTSPTTPMKQIYELRILKQKQRLQTQEGRESAVRGSRMDTSHRLIAKTSILANRPRQSRYLFFYSLSLMTTS
ncbi:hypothetical protein EDB85DRAFT_991036 [Lactarius pseudohatsudake]|nr:hypothetical protein EDB85DRAFT_991036 [Lactarius pseudohatsudake]